MIILCTILWEFCASYNTLHRQYRLTMWVTFMITQDSIINDISSCIILTYLSMIIYIRTHKWTFYIWINFESHSSVTILKYRCVLFKCVFFVYHSMNMCLLFCVLSLSEMCRVLLCAYVLHYVALSPLYRLLENSAILDQYERASVTYERMGRSYTPAWWFNETVEASLYWSYVYRNFQQQRTSNTMKMTFLVNKKGSIF